MSKEAFRDAFVAGWNACDGTDMDSVKRIAFNEWWSKSVETLDRATPVNSVQELRTKAIDELMIAIACDDPERGHLDADGTLMEFVRGLGFHDVADAYDTVRKWYA